MNSVTHPRHPRRLRYPRHDRLRVAAILTGAALLAAACGDDTADEPDPAAEPAATAAPADDDLAGTTVTLVAYDSFPVEGTGLNDALETFTADTGISVEILSAGDTGTMLSKAALTAGNPEGDVMWGVDNSFLSRAIDDEVFVPYEAEGLDAIRGDLVELVPDAIATPVDFGDVCVNADLAWFAEAGLDVPTTFDDLADPTYADLLVVQNPATSSPGLAFLAATVATYGDGWTDYWRRLVDNGVAVTDGWTAAYYERFTWAGGGDRPLVVSYGSSPPAEVIFADPPRDDSPTGVLDDTCFRQVEFAGVLAGTERPEAARELVDFLISPTFQSALPLDLFVYPARDDVALPDAFVDFAVIPDDPVVLPPDEIGAAREEWIDTWTDIVAP